jgi:hypothetical protein
LARRALTIKEKAVRKIVLMLAVSLAAAGMAAAAVPIPIPRHAPEIDPAGVLTGLTLLAGVLAVIRGRRRKP